MRIKATKSFLIHAPFPQLIHLILSLVMHSWCIHWYLKIKGFFWHFFTTPWSCVVTKLWTTKSEKTGCQEIIWIGHLIGFRDWWWSPRFEGNWVPVVIWIRGWREGFSTGLGGSWRTSGQRTRIVHDRSSRVGLLGIYIDWGLSLLYMIGEDVMSENDWYLHKLPAVFGWIFLYDSAHCLFVFGGTGRWLLGWGSWNRSRWNKRDFSDRTQGEACTLQSETFAKLPTFAIVSMRIPANS